MSSSGCSLGTEGVRRVTEGMHDINCAPQDSFAPGLAGGLLLRSLVLTSGGMFARAAASASPESRLRTSAPISTLTMDGLRISTGRGGQMPVPRRFRMFWTAFGIGVPRKYTFGWRLIACGEKGGGRERMRRARDGSRTDEKAGSRGSGLRARREVGGRGHGSRPAARKQQKRVELSLLRLASRRAAPTSPSLTHQDGHALDVHVAALPELGREALAVPEGGRAVGDAALAVEEDAEGGGDDDEGRDEVDDGADVLDDDEDGGEHDAGHHLEGGGREGEGPGEGGGDDAASLRTRRRGPGRVRSDQ